MINPFSELFKKEVRRESVAEAECKSKRVFEVIEHLTEAQALKLIQDQEIKELMGDVIKFFPTPFDLPGRTPEDHKKT